MGEQKPAIAAESLSWCREYDKKKQNSKGFRKKKVFQKSGDFQKPNVKKET